MRTYEVSLRDKVRRRWHGPAPCRRCWSAAPRVDARRTDGSCAARPAPTPRLPAAAAALLVHRLTCQPLLRPPARHRSWWTAPGGSPTWTPAPRCSSRCPAPAARWWWARAWSRSWPPAACAPAPSSPRSSRWAGGGRRALGRLRWVARPGQAAAAWAARRGGRAGLRQRLQGAWSPAAGAAKTTAASSPGSPTLRPIHHSSRPGARWAQTALAWLHSPPTHQHTAPSPPVQAWGQVDADGSRFLLGDYLGG